MKNQRKSKSLILQEVVSENPEKILFGKRSSKKLKMGEDVGAFLKELMQNRDEAKHLVLELGVKKNRSLRENNC